MKGKGSGCRKNAHGLCLTGRCCNDHWEQNITFIFHSLMVMLMEVSIMMMKIKIISVW